MSKDSWGSTFEFKGITNPDDPKIEFSITWVEIPQLDGGTFKLEAIQVGDLLVHSLNLPEGIDWRITHLPTMTKFDKALPDPIPGKRWGKQKLIDWCEKVQDDRRELWEAVAKYTPESYKEFWGSDEQQELADWCRSVEV